MKLTKRRIIDSALFLYGGVVTFGLTGIALFNIKNINNIVTLILFVPVSIYFVIRLSGLVVQGINTGLSTNHNRHPYFGDFSLATFFNQSENSFLINLTLLSLAVSIILFRISLNILK